MLEQETKNVGLSPVDVRGKLFADPLRYTPNKRMFLGMQFQKDENHKKKDVSCLKSNSKILKRKKQKDKLKLFKLEKHLWDPTIQIPQLGKAAKYFKKKNKIASNAKMIGNQISGQKIIRSVEKTNPTLSSHQPKPLEYTFDILCLTQNASPPSLIEEPEDNNTSLGNNLPIIGSYFQEVMPVQKVDVTNTSFMGDLIVLETPKPFKTKVRNSSPQVLSLSPLLIESACPYSLGKEESMQMLAPSEVKIPGSGELEELSANSSTAHIENHNVHVSTEENSGFELDDKPNGSELPEDLSNSKWQGDKACSPLVFYGFPGLDSPAAKTEKQQISVSHHPHQRLVDQLNKDPFPKVVREDAKVLVRRRAFSMNNALMSSLLCRTLDIVNPESSLEVGNGEAPGPQNTDVDSSSRKSSVPIEGIEQNCSMFNGEIDSTDHLKRCCRSNEIVSNNFTDCPNGTIESNIDIAIDDDMDIHMPEPQRSINMPGAAENPISEVDSGSNVLTEVSVVNVSQEDSNYIIPENSLGSSHLTAAKEFENVPCNIEDSKRADDLELTSYSASGNIAPTQGQNDCPSTNNSTCTEQLCESTGENQSTDSPTANIEELSDCSNFIVQPKVSLDLEIVLDSSLNAEQGIANSKVDEIAPEETLPQNSLGQTPVLYPSDEKELAEGLAPIIPLTNLDGNEVSRLTHQGTSTTLGIGLSSLEPSNTNSEASDLGKGLEQCSDHTLVDIFDQAVDQSIGGSGSGDAEPIIPSTEEIATPTGITSRFDDNDSSFGDQSCMTPLEHWVLPTGKKYRRSLSIIRNLDEHPSANARRGRHYEISVEEIIKLQGNTAEARTPLQSLRKRLSMRRSVWSRKITPPQVRRNTFIWSPKITDRGTLYETPHSRKSIYSTPLQQSLARRMSVTVSPMRGPNRRSVRPPFNQTCSPASPVEYTIMDLILTICKQTEPCSFSDILNEESYKGGCKLGEGVFGEVFSINHDCQNTVLKIIPIEGLQLVNGEKQKTYQEVLSELVIAKVLYELSYENSDESNRTSGFAELMATSLVQGSYPTPLLQFWEEFDQTKGSDNDNPKMFDEEQLFIVMEQGNGGKDLERYTFSSAKQSLSIFKQIAFSLAVAELAAEFEHRDLHWGNVLVSKTSEKHIFYTLNGTQYSVASNGVKCTIIDYTLSRIKYINQIPIYNDIGKDPEMFIATGDYQFDIYRFMKKDVEDDWSRFVPKTNARWLHYLLGKMLTKVKYQRKTAKVHKDSFKVLEGIGKWIEDCGSALSIALRLAELKI